MSTSKFLVMWCNEGLETLINITLREQEQIVSVLNGEPIKHSNPIQYMILRAKFNAQRFYEIYIFESEITEDEILELFNTDPQTIVNAIRDVGNKIYSEPRSNSKIVIT